MDWNDCRGSMGRYCTMLGMKDDKFISLTNDLNAHVYKDYSENKQNLFADFKPLFNLLENGLYFLNYSKNIARNIHNEHLVFPKTAITEKTFTNENENDILLFTSQWYFEDVSNFFIIATQLESSINKERIEFYKNEIIQGKRPFIITIYKSYIEDKLTPNKINEYVEWDSALFLLDGHHKFIAYKELGIFPPSFTICQGFSNSNEIYFDFESLQNSLNKYQIKHLTRNII
ncbi:hypothetical protein ACFO3O_17925 [Dokdonia ponticola]|uniref:Uncharacterized protein n=1 Tax=Dokdonia ponticola TaxID=2041041 RepID=A0ABV9I2W7_9FLAO